MKVKLIRQARVTLKAGEIVEVSPEQAHFLLSTHCAVEIAEAVKETPTAPARQTRTKKGAK